MIYSYNKSQRDAQFLKFNVLLFPLVHIINTLKHIKLFKILLHVSTILSSSGSNLLPRQNHYLYYCSYYAITMLWLCDNMSVKGVFFKSLVSCVVWISWLVTVHSGVPG